MLLLTTLDAWRADASGAPFVLDDAPAAWAPEGDDALAIADDVFPSGQVIAISLDREPRRVPLPGVIDRSRVARIRYARRGPAGRHVALLDRPAIADGLDLLPHPEGGWFRETWRTSFQCHPDGRGERASATGIYFLLPPDEESVWHAVASDELWLWHRGGPLTLILGGIGDRPDAHSRTITLGPDVEHGRQPQALVPAHTWQSAKPAADEPVLVSCVVSPGFDFADFRTLEP